MDILDLIIAAVILLGGWNGYRVGLFRQITRLFGAVIAYALARWLKPYLAPAIHSMHLVPEPTGVWGLFLGNADNAVAFAIIFVIAFLLLRYGAGLIDTLFQLPGLSLVNRLAGLIAGLALAIVFIYVASLLAHYVPNQGLQKQLANSAIIRYLDSQNIGHISHSLTS